MAANTERSEGNISSYSGKFIPLQRQSALGVSGNFVPKRAFSDYRWANTVIACGTRPWSASGGRGEFSRHPLDDRHAGGTEPGPRGAVRFSRVVPALLVSALRLHSAPRAFAGRCP